MGSSCWRQKLPDAGSCPGRLEAARGPEAVKGGKPPAAPCHKRTSPLCMETLFRWAPRPSLGL
eukprot:362227-Chlamydomonas_euryale.AAC.2